MVGREKPVKKAGSTNVVPIPLTLSPWPRETSFRLVPLAEDIAPLGHWCTEPSSFNKARGALAVPLARA